MSFYKYCVLFFAYSISFGKVKVVETMRHKQRWMAVGGVTMQFRSSGPEKASKWRSFNKGTRLYPLVYRPSAPSLLLFFLFPPVFFSLAPYFLRVLCPSCVFCFHPLVFPLVSVSFCYLAIMLIIACLLDRDEWVHL